MNAEEREVIKEVLLLILNDIEVTYHLTDLGSMMG